MNNLADAIDRQLWCLAAGIFGVRWVRPTKRAGGLGGTRREKTAVSARSFFPFR
jgi:hypothetical protein